MGVREFITRLTRHIQGERRGMGSELQKLTPSQALLEQVIVSPSGILIQTLVQLADVSFWQGVIDFVRMRASGIAGVIIRAGQNTWEDVKFRINWALAKAARIPRGSYWFYDSRKSPKEQAELWWSLIQADRGELVHVADFEESYNGPYGSRAHLREFLERFQQLSGLADDRIVIYTGFFWWVERVGDDPFFRRYQLWLASYGSMSAARIPAPWSAADLLFWQYTASGDGPAHGVSSHEIDLNWYCCSPDDYIKRFQITEGEPMPDPTGYIFKITPFFTDGCRIRPEPDTGNTPLTTKLLHRQYAYGNRRVTIAEDKWEDINDVRTQVNMAGDVWLEVVLVNGQPLPTPHYIAEIHKGQRVATITQLAPVPDPDPDPEQPPVLPDLPVTILLGDDVTYARQTINTTLKRMS